MSLSEKIADIEAEIAGTKYNKATQHHIGKLKAKLAQLREQVVAASSGPKGSGYSVRKAGERVRVTVQLIEGADDRHVWAERYDRDRGCPA